MLKRIIDWSVANKLIVLLFVIAGAAGGIWAIRHTPLEALPDLSDVQVIIQADYNEQAPRIVEDQVTYPIAAEMLKVPGARTVRGYKEALLRTPEDGTVISRGFTGKTLRAVRNEWTQHIEEHPEELAKFPEQMARAVQANALHLGGDENSDVDPDKECYPAGQGVGAMHELIPAGDLVRSIVDEAEHALARAAKTVLI